MFGFMLLAISIVSAQIAENGKLLKLSNCTDNKQCLSGDCSVQPRLQEMGLICWAETINGRPGIGAQCSIDIECASNFCHPKLLYCDISSNNTNLLGGKPIEEPTTVTSVVQPKTVYLSTTPSIVPTQTVVVVNGQQINTATAVTSVQVITPTPFKRSDSVVLSTGSMVVMGCLGWLFAT